MYVFSAISLQNISKFSDRERGGGGGGGGEEKGDRSYWAFNIICDKRIFNNNWASP